MDQRPDPFIFDELFAPRVHRKRQLLAGAVAAVLAGVLGAGVLLAASGGGNGAGNSGSPPRSGNASLLALADFATPTPQASPTPPVSPSPLASATAAPSGTPTGVVPSTPTVVPPSPTATIARVVPATSDAAASAAPALTNATPDPSPTNALTTVPQAGIITAASTPVSTLTPSATASNTPAAATATPTRTPTTTPPSNVAMSDLERDMFDRHNAARASAGVAPLRADAGVMGVARERASDMARTGEFTHSPSNGKTYIALLNANGVPYRGAGENIAYNTYPTAQTVEVAMRGLLNSPGHYANIVRSTFTHVGIGIAIAADGDKYFAIVFIGR